MIQHVNQFPIYSIFDQNTQVYYFIPKYQRAYAWYNKEWEALFNDIDENPEGYYIGSIICINQNDYTQPIVEVIDGQQRLTTICLLLAAIYNKLNGMKEQLEEEPELMHEFLGVKLSLSSKNSPNKLKLVPQIQDCNIDDFNCIMYEAGIKKEVVQRRPYFPVRKVYKCYKYFSDRLQSIINSESTEQGAIQKLMAYFNKVKMATLVKIEVNTHSDAYVLFESLNNRGVPLTPIDLMKNLLIARAEANGMSADDCFSQWQTLLFDLSDDYAVQERFFRQYYNAFRNILNIPFVNDEDKRKKYPLGVVATKSNLLSIYERIIKKDLIGFLQEIITCGHLYAQIVFPDRVGFESPYSAKLLDLQHIQGTPSYLLIMYLLRFKDKLGLTDELINGIVSFLSVFFVHRNVTDYPGTRDLTRIFMEIIMLIEDNMLTGNSVCNKIVNTLKDNCLEDATFEERLRGNLYKENFEVTRYLLCSLAERAMTKESNNTLWNRNGSGSYIWTIEHIFPEGENIPQEWVDMIADGDNEKAKMYLYEYTHRLGNLTMTGYNSTLSNLPFEKKRDRRDKQGNYVGYKNGLSINADIAEKDRWTIDDIKERTDKLVAQLMDMYKL